MTIVVASADNDYDDNVGNVGDKYGGVNGNNNDYDDGDYNLKKKLQRCVAGLAFRFGGNKFTYAKLTEKMRKETLYNLARYSYLFDFWL